jgi:hypothetical protein
VRVIAVDSGVTSWLTRNGVRGVAPVAIAPNLDERHLDTLYQSNGVEDLHGPDVLDSADLSTATGRADAQTSCRTPVSSAQGIPALPSETGRRSARGLGLVGCQAKGTEGNPPK